jgi:hypothetical protein
LPERIEHAVEDVKEHRTDVTAAGPVGWNISRLFGNGGTSVKLGISVTTTVDNHCHDEEESPRQFGSERTADLLHIKEVTNSKCTNDLCEVVQAAVQGLGTCAEASSIYRVLLVDVEPVGSPEHRDQKDDPWLEFGGLKQSHDLGCPAGMLHENDLGSILSDDLLRVDESERKDGTAEHENNEGDVGAVGDSRVSRDVDVLAEWDLLERGE